MVLYGGGLSKRFYKPIGSAYGNAVDSSSLVKNADGTYLLTEIGGGKYLFAANKKIRSITDRYSNSISIDNSVTGMTTVTDSAGHASTVSYNPSTGLVGSIRDPAGNVYDFAYNAAGLLGKVTYPDPSANETARPYWEYLYNAAGLLEYKIDPMRHIVKYAYDDGGRIHESTDPGGVQDTAGSIVAEGHTKSLTYSPAGGVITLIEKDGGQWTYTYDPKTKVVKERTAPDGSREDFCYNPDLTLKAASKPYDIGKRLTTFYTYDSRGNILGETEPIDLSVFTSPPIDPATVDLATFATLTPPIRWAFGYSYDENNYNALKTVTDNRGATPLTTTYDRYTEKDSQGGTLSVTRTTAPGETSDTKLVSYERQNPNGTLFSTTDANGRSTSFSYYPVDATNAGMLQTITTADGVKLTFTAYDKNGNVTESRVTDANNNPIPIKVMQSYDSRDQLASVVKESTTLPIRFPTNVTKYGYDSNGNLSSVTDAEGRSTTYQYTYQGKIAEITDARSKSTKFDYSASGCPSCSGGDQLTSVRDANHQTKNEPGTVYTYTFNRLDTETDPLGNKIRYTYYDGGLLKEKIDTSNPNSEKVLITYLYNSRGQLTDKLYPDNTSAHYTYDANGRLETASNRASATTTFSYTYTYYNNGRMKSVTDSNGRTISYDQYDGIGQSKKVTLFPNTADQRIVTYDYDAANRPGNIYSSGGTFTFSYDALGRRSRRANPNGTQTDYSYDDLNRLTSLNHNITGGSTIMANGYPEYDQTGNIKTRTGDYPASYLYDELYRLKQSSTPWGEEKYDYDDVGNRTKGPGAKDITYRYNSGNQMLVGRTLSYGYDDMGNQTQRIIGNAAEKTWSIAWDSENRIIKMERIKGAAEKQTVTFRYDPMGRRIEKKNVVIKDGSTKTTTTAYVYDNDRIVLELEDDGSTTTKTFYTHGPGTDEPLSMERNNKYFFYHADHLGSIMAVTNISKTIIQRYSYDAFGMPKTMTNFKSNYQFTGREWDREIGLYYYRARYYDPMEGRFMSKDPIGFGGGDVNLYGLLAISSG